MARWAKNRKRNVAKVFAYKGKILNAELKRAKKDRGLMTITRPSIDDRSITGFLLEYSSELILIQYVYDFHLDGLMVLRRSDVEEIKSSRTDRYQTEMMKAEGLYQAVKFNAKHIVSDWPETIKHFQEQYRFVILEAEEINPTLFVLGRLTVIKSKPSRYMDLTALGNGMMNRPSFHSPILLASS